MQRGHLITGGNLFGLLLTELLAGNVEVVPEASGAICLTSFLMYSSASSTSSGANCGQTLCGDILTVNSKISGGYAYCLLYPTIIGKKSKYRVKF